MVNSHEEIVYSKKELAIKEMKDFSNIIETLKNYE